MLERFKIALCQMKVVDNKDENLQKAIAMIDKAKEKVADIAVLPEMFNCPYENEKFIEYGEKQEDSYSLDTIANAAKKAGIHVLAGSIPEKVSVNGENVVNGGEICSEHIYNTSFLFDDNGETLGFHRKMHLFDVDIEDEICFKESDTLKSGDGVTVLDTKFGKVGIAICYDIRFPELSRLMALENANILVFPSAFNLTTGPAHWELLFRTRAIDNQVFTCGVSPALNEDASYNAYGHSILCNPWGDVIAKAGYDEELIIAEIDLNEVFDVRKKLPLMKNRRSDVYSLKLKK